MEVEFPILHWPIGFEIPEIYSLWYSTGHTEIQPYPILLGTCTSVSCMFPFKADTYKKFQFFLQCSTHFHGFKNCMCFMIACPSVHILNVISLLLMKWVMACVLLEMFMWCYRYEQHDDSSMLNSILLGGVYAGYTTCCMCRKFMRI